MDNRLQFPPTEVDWSVVGTTGQAHDTYPAPGQPPRYDWQRMMHIALLSCQSSDDPPTQYRTGTLWHRLTDGAYLYWNGSAWASISEAIYVTSGSDPSTLQDICDLIATKSNALLPKMTYSGTVVNEGTTQIPIPTSLQTIIAPIKDLLKPTLYVNGLLKDPRLYAFSSGCPTCIDIISGITLHVGDKFTIMIERFDQFVTDEIHA